MSLRSAYLVAYNLVCCVGWSFVLFECILSIQQKSDLWNNVHLILLCTQSLAILEIVHAMVKLVKSPVISTAMQVASRLFCLWGIVYLVPETRHFWGFTMMVTSWALVEVPRYLFYAINILTKVPSSLFFLRYHLFMVLYPTGVAGIAPNDYSKFTYSILGEVSCMVMALLSTTTNLYGIYLPNALNVTLSLPLIIKVVLMVYVPGLPVMYSHMLVQRKKAYGKLKTL